MKGTMQRTPQKCATKVQTPPAKIEFSCKASSKASRKGGSKDKLVYPKLKRFCLSKEELNEEHGLSLVGKLPKALSKEDISEEDWLSVFRVQCVKNTNIFLHMVRSEFMDECGFLYQKVYQAVASNNEIAHKFARCFAYERCTSAKHDSEGHRIAWAAFGESVLETCKMQPGGLQKKISNWRSVYGPTNIQGSVVDLAVDEGGSKEGKASSFGTKDIPVLLAYSRTNSLALSIGECSGKRDAMLRNKGARTAATIFLTELGKDKQQQESLRVQPHPNMDQIGLLEVQIEASSCTLRLLGLDESMLHVEDEVALMKGSAAPINFIIREVPVNERQGPILVNISKAKSNRASFAEVVKGVSLSGTTSGISAGQNHDSFGNPAQSNPAKDVIVGIPLMPQNIEMLKKKKELLDEELHEVVRQLN
ncbi:hypothetical protein L7F22_068310 [Adiantum nelumboides]|nr:hypothetical protein [Adiantum nelumboides]